MMSCPTRHLSLGSSSDSMESIGPVVVLGAFYEQCEDYVAAPVNLRCVVSEL